MKLKRILALACCAVLLVCISVGATLAYLTDDATVTNTFTVGKVEITLDEAKVDEYGEEVEGADRVTENVYKLVPGHKYTKDPTVHVAAGSEDAWLFVKVENGIAAIEADTKIKAQMIANGWTAVAGVAGYYQYKDVVSAGDNIPVFGSFTLTDDADVAAYTAAQIKITAYAVQVDGVAKADAWAALGL